MIRRPVLATALALLSFSAGAAPREANPTDVFVDAVAKGSAGERADLHAGDRLIDWSRADGVEPASGAFRSPFDYRDVVAAQSARGTLRIRLERGHSVLEATVAPDGFGLEPRPDLDPALLAALEEARGAAKGDPREKAVAQLAGLGKRTPPLVHAWVVLTAAKLSGDATKTEALLKEAVEAARPNGLAVAWILEQVAGSRRSRSDLPGAETAFREALAARIAAGAPDLLLARSWHDIGGISLIRRELDNADEAIRKAEAIRGRLIPESMDHAKSCNNLSLVAKIRGNLDESEEWFAKTLAIKEKLVPGSLELAATYDNRSLLAADRGRLAEAEEWVEKAIAIEERLAPESAVVAMTYANSGLIAEARGDLDDAERMLRRSLAIKEKLGVDGIDLAANLNNLGIVAGGRGDYEAAESWYRQSIAITERDAPESLELAAAYVNLGNVVSRRGDAEAAETWLRRALAIHVRIAPGGKDAAATFADLGNLALHRGETDAADLWYREDLAIMSKIAPGSIEEAIAFASLGEVARARGHREEARHWYTNALQLELLQAPDRATTAVTEMSLADIERELGDLALAESLGTDSARVLHRFAPGTSDESTALWHLGRTFRRAGRREQAIATLRCAIEALESQQTRLGGTKENLASFREKNLGLYQELAELLLEQGRATEAFDVLESSRARALLALLAERDLAVSDVPVELERERRRANADHDHATAALAGAGDGLAREAALQVLEGVRERQEELRARVRASSPRLASIRYPEPLPLGAIQRSLPEGTLLLTWTLGENGSALFAVSRHSFLGSQIPVTVKTARNSIRRLRAQLQDPGSSPKEIERDATALASSLLGPAASALALSKRVVLVPDGPLWLLPFAVLPDVARPGSRFAATRPLSYVSSATVLAELVRRRAAPFSRPDLVALGDPVYPGEAVSLRRGSTTFSPLPATRGEVEGIGRIFGAGATTWLGRDATEERAKALSATRPSILHFAAHGVVDEQFPLESAVALSLRRASPETAGKEGDDGLLQAFEIIERMRIDSELVVLSACETALGKEVAGEGIVGLTRAFQIAGARSVLASLWSVADESTAELMTRFYRGFRNGLPKDEALRRAQQELAKEPIRTAGGRILDATHPFHWAAFVLVGDGK